MLAPQQTDGAQIKSLLRIAKTRAEFVQPRGEKFGAFQLLVGIGVCPHEKEQQLWILGRRGAVDRFQVFELWACRARLSLVRADSDRCIFSEGSQKSRAEHQHEDEKDKLSHGGNPFRRMILRNDRCIYIYYGTRIMPLSPRSWLGPRWSAFASNPKVPTPFASDVPPPPNVVERPRFDAFLLPSNERHVHVCPFQT